MPRTEDLGDGPSLSDAAARIEGCITVEDFPERAQTVRMDLLREQFE